VYNCKPISDGFIVNAEGAIIKPAERSDEFLRKERLVCMMRFFNNEFNVLIFLIRRHSLFSI
jgi:hypothetical protein